MERWQGGCWSAAQRLTCDVLSQPSLQCTTTDIRHLSTESAIFTAPARMTWKYYQSINQSVCQTLSQAGSQSVSESVCLSASVCQSVNRPIGSSVSLSFGLLASWSVCQSLNSLPVCLIVSLSVCVSIYLFVCLSVSHLLINGILTVLLPSGRKNWEYEKWQIKVGYRSWYFTAAMKT